ncbi:hypothetical protein ACOMHN_057089 [Nucella lapillus]
MTTTLPENTVHDIDYDFSVRVTVLYVQIVLGTLGGVLVMVWMLYNRRLRTRVNALILNLCVADLMVMTFGCTSQLVWEYTSREWLAGDVMCRVIKFLMIFSNCASTNMLVVIAIDRHQAIRSPLRDPFAVWMMTGTGWLAAALCTSPMLFVFQTRYDPVRQMTMCQNIFRNKPLAHRQAFLTYGSFVNFLIPLVVLIVCYTRIFLKISKKASESQNNQLNKRQNFKPGKVHLTSTGSSSLPKAKIKTLKMTLVIVAAFIFFGLPYFVAEMILSYGDFKQLNASVYALLGGVAPANSAINPYIFLLFSANMQDETIPLFVEAQTHYACEALHRGLARAVPLLSAAPDSPHRQGVSHVVSNARHGCSLDDSGWGRRRRRCSRWPSNWPLDVDKGMYQTHAQCLRGLKLCPAQAETGRRHLMSSTASTRSDYSASYSRSPHLLTTDTLEMSSLK